MSVIRPVYTFYGTCAIVPRTKRRASHEYTLIGCKICLNVRNVHTRIYIYISYTLEARCFIFFPLALNNIVPGSYCFCGPEIVTRLRCTVIILCWCFFFFFRLFVYFFFRKLWNAVLLQWENAVYRVRPRVSVLRARSKSTIFRTRPDTHSRGRERPFGTGLVDIINVFVEKKFQINSYCFNYNIFEKSEDIFKAYFIPKTSTFDFNWLEIFFGQIIKTR